MAESIRINGDVTPAHVSRDAMEQGAKQAQALWDNALHCVSLWYVIGFLIGIVQNLNRREGNIIAHHALNAVQNSIKE